MESIAVDAVRALLEHVPNTQIIGVRHEQHLESGHQLDVRIDLDYDYTGQSRPDSVLPRQIGTLTQFVGRDVDGELPVVLVADGTGLGDSRTEE